MSEQESTELEQPEITPQAEEAGDDLEADSKRRMIRGTLVLGVLALAAAGGLWMMYARSGTSALGKEAAEAQKAITTFLGDGKKNMATLQAAFSDTDKIVDQFRSFPAAAQVPLEDLNKNPFSASVATSATTTDNTAPDREKARVEALKRAGSLKLQSIMFSDASRSCMINNRFQAEGDTIDGFVVERITQSNVIVKTNGFRFELKVAR